MIENTDFDLSEETSEGNFIDPIKRALVEEVKGSIKDSRFKQELGMEVAGEMSGIPFAGIFVDKALNVSKNARFYRHKAITRVHDAQDGRTTRHGHWRDDSELSEEQKQFKNLVLELSLKVQQDFIKEFHHLLESSKLSLSCPEEEKEKRKAFHQEIASRLLVYVPISTDLLETIYKTEFENDEAWLEFKKLFKNRLKGIDVESIPDYLERYGNAMMFSSNVDKMINTRHTFVTDPSKAKSSKSSKAESFGNSLEDRNTLMPISISVLWKAFVKASKAKDQSKALDQKLFDKLLSNFQLFFKEHIVFTFLELYTDFLKGFLNIQSDSQSKDSHTLNNTRFSEFFNIVVFLTDENFLKEYKNSSAFWSDEFFQDLKRLSHEINRFLEFKNFVVEAPAKRILNLFKSFKNLSESEISKLNAMCTPDIRQYLELLVDNEQTHYSFEELKESLKELSRLSINLKSSTPALLYAKSVEHLNINELDSTGKLDKVDENLRAGLKSRLYDKNAEDRLNELETLIKEFEKIKSIENFTKTQQSNTSFSIDQETEISQRIGMKFQKKSKLRT